MSDNYQGDSYISNLVNKVVSEGGENAQHITKLIKSGGEVVGYELESGDHISIQEAVNMAKQNALKHVGVAVAKDGHEYIRSLPDGDESNNLGNLPSITQDQE